MRKIVIPVGSSFIISSLFGIAPSSLLFEEILELDGFSSVHFRFLNVFLDDIVIVEDLSLERVSSISESISLGGEVSEFLGPSSSFSVFPTGISSSGSSDLVLEGGQEGGDLSEELWVVGRGSDLSERVDEWSISGEFVIEVGHVGESLGDGLDSTLELDEEGTSGEGSNEVDSILAGSDTSFMFSIELRPGSVLHVSLGLTGFDSGVDRVEFSKGSIELFFGISEKSLGVSNSLVTVVGLSGVVVSVVGILWEESVTSGSGLSVNGISSSLLVVKVTHEAINHTNDVGEVVLTSRHVDRDLSEDSFSEWMGIDLWKI